MSLSRPGTAGHASSQDAGAAESIERVIDETGYADRLRLEGEEGEDRLENLYELVGAAKEFDQIWGLGPQASGLGLARPSVCELPGSSHEISAHRLPQADRGPVRAA